MSIADFLKSKTPLLQYSDDDVKTILAQYDRKPENIGEDIDVIKKWFTAQPHIPVEPSDRIIVAFLIMNKFSIEKTKEKLDLNFTMKSIIPEYYSLLPKDSQTISISKAYHFFPMPKLTNKLNRLHISKLHDGDMFHMNNFMAFFFLTFDMRAYSDICNSEEYIMDLENFTVGAATKIGPMQVQKCFLILEKVYANRIACIHIINAPSYADTLISFLRAGMKAKLRSRLLIHKNSEALHEYYTKDVLPKEYGGEAESYFVLNDNWMKYLIENQDYLEEIHNIKINEELRPNKLVNDDVLGFHGNFRKLEVD